MVLRDDQIPSLGEPNGIGVSSGPLLGCGHGYILTIEKVLVTAGGYEITDEFVYEGQGRNSYCGKAQGCEHQRQGTSSECVMSLCSIFSQMVSFFWRKKFQAHVPDPPVSVTLFRPPQAVPGSKCS